MLQGPRFYLDWVARSGAGRCGDTRTGRITFASVPESAPATSFQFDVPVRFDTGSLPVRANAWDLQIVNNIDLVEVLE